MRRSRGDEVIEAWTAYVRQWTPTTRRGSDDCPACWEWPGRSLLPGDTPNALVHRLRLEIRTVLDRAVERHRASLLEEFAVEETDDLDDIAEARERLEFAELDRHRLLLLELFDRRAELAAVVSAEVRPRVDAWVAESVRYLLVLDDEP